MVALPRAPRRAGFAPAGAALALSAVFALGACGGDDSPPDGGPADAAVDGGGDAAPMAPRPPALGPCPPGWRTVLEGDVMTCDPYPEGGPSACDPGEVHFPGGAGCEAIGDPCPAGDFAEDLPPDTIYVLAGGDPAGDGSSAAPYDGLSRVSWTSLAAGTTVALSKGRFEGSLPLKAGVEVVGACARDTVLTGLAAPIAAVVVVTSAGEPTVVRNLSISGAPQHGVNVGGGRSLRLEGVHLEAVTAVGINMYEPGTTVALDEVVISRTEPGPGGWYGRGIAVEGGASLEASRVVVRSSTEIGIALLVEGARAQLADVAVIDTLSSRADPPDAVGILVGLSAQLEASRLYLAGNRGASIAIADEGSAADLEDVVVRGSRVQERGLEIGAGIQVQLGASLVATRMTLDSNEAVAVNIAAASAALSDVVVRDTQPSGRSANDGYGLWVQNGAHLEAERVLVARAHDVGVGCSNPGSAFTGADVTVRSTQPQMTDGEGGYGIMAQLGCRLTVDRFLVAGAHTLGFGVIHGGEAVATDGRIIDVAVAGCATTTCGDRTFGYGVGALRGRLELTRFEVSRAATCGVMVDAADANLDLSHGVVSGSAIGACIQQDGYEVARLSDDVEYRDNGTNLDSTSLPVPVPVNAVAGR